VAALIAATLLCHGGNGGGALHALCETLRLLTLLPVAVASVPRGMAAHAGVALQEERGGLSRLVAIAGPCCCGSRPIQTAPQLSPCDANVPHPEQLFNL